MEYLSPHAERSQQELEAQASEFVDRVQSLIDAADGLPRHFDTMTSEQRGVFIEFNRLHDEVESLPRADAELSAKVYARLAESGYVRDRRFIVSYVGQMLAVDQECGLRLLTWLAGDSDQYVQQQAWDTFKGDIIEREGATISAREAFPVVMSFIDSFDLIPKKIRP